jgi:uncharacterized protein YbaP (TraB family)
LRLIGRLLTGFALVAGYAVAALAQAPACTGKNILEELRTTDPAMHARIVAVAEGTENAKAIFWRVEKAGTAPSHLFGTIHLTDERVNRLSPAVKKELDNARRLLLEIDDPSPEAMAQQILKSPRLANLMVFTDGRRLDQLLDGPDYEKLSRALSRLGVPAQDAGTFRPWIATLMLAVSECEQRRESAGLLVLDDRLAKETERRGLKALGLETVASQLQALSSVPEADQIDVLRSAVRYYHRADDLIETMVQLYERRQLAAMWPLQLELAEKVGVGRKAFDSYEEALLTKRNLGMRDAALPHLAEGRAFIAVGALHLPGRNGLVTLLRGAGYTVTAVE